MSEETNEDFSNVVVDLRNVPESGDYDAAPGARYPLTVVKAEASRSKPSAKNPNGALMLKLQLAIAEGEHKDKLIFDNIIADASAKGARFGRDKLVQLGVPVDAQTLPILQIANWLIGKTIWADVNTEPNFGLDPATKEYTVPTFRLVDGKQVQSQRNKIDRYYTTAPTTQAVPVPQYATLPQTPAQAVAPQFASAPQLAFAQSGPQQQFVAPSGPPNGGGFAQFPPQGGVAPWQTPGGPEAATGGRKSKKTQ